MSIPNADAPRDAARVPLSALLSLDGKTALITGGAAGIGRAIAWRLSEAGADLVLVDRDAGSLEATHDALAEAGRRVRAFAVDVSDAEAVAGLWAELAESAPDVLVNNAGAYLGRSFERIDAAYYDRTMGVNLEAAVWMCRHMIEHRGRRGGVIVNVGSIEAILPFKQDLALYSVAKAGVLALTRALAREHARDGFRVNAVVPGGIVTPGTRTEAANVLRFRFGLVKTGWDFLQRLPAGRLGQPDEVARVVLFLASDLASYMHGAVVPVDGGFLST